MFSCQYSPPLVTKNAQKQIGAVLKPERILSNASKHAVFHGSITNRGLIKNLLNFNDLHSVVKAVADIEAVGVKTVGIDRNRLLAVKKAIQRRIRNQYQLKIIEISMLDPSQRSMEVHELTELQAALPPLRPEFPCETAPLMAYVGTLGVIEQSQQLLRETKAMLELAQKAVISWTRQPVEEPVGRRVALSATTVGVLMKLFSAGQDDANVCTTLCEIGRRWGEPYWAAYHDSLDMELLHERRDLMLQNGVEIVATETLHKFQHHPHLGHRATIHSIHLLALLNVKLFMWVIKSNSSQAVCEAALTAMVQIINEGRADDLARYGGRYLMKEYETRFGNTPTIRLLVLNVSKSLQKSTVKDIYISTYKTGWALEDLRIARKLFDGLDTHGTGEARAENLGELFRTMGMKMTDSELQKQVELMDVNKSGRIEWPEFLYMVETWGGVRNWSIESQFEEDTLKSLRTLFDRFDADCSGDIDASELHTMFDALCIPVSEADIATMIHEVDADGSGSIGWYEFLFLMSKNTDQNRTVSVHRCAFKLFESKRVEDKINCHEFGKVIIKLTKGAITSQDMDDICSYVKTLSNSSDMEYLDYKEFVLLMTM